jgi:methyltransferase (TIGR00027 family)
VRREERSPQLRPVWAVSLALTRTPFLLPEPRVCHPLVLVEVRAASRTAVFVCQGRAVADGRVAVGRFADSVAVQLLRGDELEAVERARADGDPADWRERLGVEALRACAEVVAPRTVAIDKAVAAFAFGQVVIVGAGLDTRPWRLEALREATVLLVDHPASQADARERSAGLVARARAVHYVPVELARARLDDALDGGHDASVPTTWIWEGVVPYLTRAEVAATLAAVAARSARGSVLIVNYQAPSLAAALGRRLAHLASRAAGQASPLAGEPWRSLWSPAAMRKLLARNGFRVREDRDLLEIALAIGSPATRRRSLRTGRVAVAST